MPRPTRTRRNVLTQSSLGAGLFLLTPQIARFLPPCPIHALTGLLCPGCGGTRCLLALLRGDFASAWHRNALLTVLLPAALLLFAAHLLASTRNCPSPATTLLHSRPLLWSLAAATLLFGVGRNLV